MARRIQIFRRRNKLMQMRFYFRFVSDNEEPIAQSEGYTQKHNATEVIDKYWPEWEVEDLTDKKYTSTWGR